MAAPLPKEVVDSHHHFLDTTNNGFQSFIRSLAGDVAYLPEQYDDDVVKPLSQAGVTVVGTVHVEAMPDDGASESAWVRSMIDSGRCPLVKAIVASCDLTSQTVDDDLRKIIASCPKQIRGIRWIVDCVGKFDGGKSATAPATLRHDGVDYLKEPAFESGLVSLAKLDLSFDLQCAPVQLVDSAVDLIGRHPKLRVCIDHLGKPMKLLGEDLDEEGSVCQNTVPDANQLALWRRGMKAMAALPLVYIKISMLGFAVPGWIRTPERIALMKSLVRETIDLFGPGRCMVAWNWYVNGAVSDADGKSEVGPDALELCRHFVSFFEGYSEEDRERLFAGTAKDFYRFS